MTQQPQPGLTPHTPAAAPRDAPVTFTEQNRLGPFRPTHEPGFYRQFNGFIDGLVNMRDAASSIKVLKSNRREHAQLFPH